MTALTPAFDAALAGSSVTVFGAVSIALPSFTLNLLDGSGTLTFGGLTYVGRDATYGVLAACDNISDGSTDEAPSIKITLNPASNAAAADLASANMQGSPVSVYVGAVNPATGTVIADPYLLFLGELDVPTLSSRRDGRDLSYTVVSSLERCLTDDEGQRLAPGRQRAIYANDAGLDDVSGVETNVYWGVAGENQGISYSAPNIASQIYGAFSR